jgi:hypothetical protein
MKEGKKMEKYKVIIKEEYIRTIEVEAVDKAEALDKIIKQYSNEDIVLDTDDFFDVEFEVVGNK